MRGRHSDRETDRETDWKTDKQNDRKHIYYFVKTLLLMRIVNVKMRKVGKAHVMMKKETSKIFLSLLGGRHDIFPLSVRIALCTEYY